MKKVIAVTLALALASTGCADNKNLPVASNGTTKEVVTYGLIDKADEKVECVNYSLAWGNIVWSGVFVASVIVPIYMVGFSLYEPDSVDQECLDKKFKKELDES